MLRAQILTALLGLLLISLVAAPPANAECRSTASCYMSTDYDYEQTDGPYDPCYNNFSWTFDFHRTSKTSSSTVILWKISNQQGGTVIVYTYDSRDYPPNTNQHFEGVDPVGNSNWHKLHLLKWGGSGGHFTYLDLEGMYVAGDPGRP